MPIVSATCECDRCGAIESSKRDAYYPAGWTCDYLPENEDTSRHMLLCRECRRGLVEWLALVPVKSAAKDGVKGGKA